MSKITLNHVGSLIDATTAASTINADLDTIQTAFDNTVSRDGTSPNKMLAPLDMNSQRILNLPAPTSGLEPVRLVDVTTAATLAGALAKVNNLSDVASIPATKVNLALIKADVGLGNVDNTSDVNKPVSTAQATALALKANTASPTITGNATFSGNIISSNVFGGLTPGSSLILGATTDISGTGATGLYGSTVTIGNSQNAASIINLNGASGGGVTVNIAAANNGLNALNVFNGAGGKQVWVPGSGTGTTPGTITFPAATDTLVGKATTDTLTNKTLTTPVISTATPTTAATLGYNAGLLTFGDGVNSRSVVASDTTQTLTNKTIDTAGPNTIKVNGNTLSATAGTATVTVPNVTGTLALTSGTVATVKKQTFTASGTYTPSAGMLYAIIECVGSGGGGGSAAGTVGQLYAGGGGGSGSYSRLVASAATIGVSQTVTVGNAGTGGASGSNNGTAGSDVSVGTLCIGKGGAGGLFGANAQVGGGGAGGISGTGDLVGAGVPGGPGIYNSTAFQPVFPAGSGGSSIFGGGAAGPAFTAGTAVAGANATGFGSGGSGAIASNVAANAAGGNGSKGVVFITEYCNQ